MTMTRMRTKMLLAGAMASILVGVTAPVLADQSSDAQQVKLAKGTWWGKAGDVVEIEFKDGLYVRKLTGTVVKIDKGIVTLEGNFDGRKSTRPIFASEIQSIKPADAAAAPEVKDEPKTAPSTTKDTGPRLTPENLPAPGNVGVMDDFQRGARKKQRIGDNKLGYGTETAAVGKDSAGFPIDAKGYRISPKPGVFVLPWGDTVGQTARAFEIEQIANEADKWGPGQIIVLDIDSPGGLVSEIYRISDTIKEVRKRHRLV